ncbi:hypothetical protein M422DRAFT_266257 [Sphaerobolus stellatus SS14]|uniref:cystathionine gamma-lyase n=1 Tax=Sphaerobolus stellatus (strain SS14) TaxID=990650 RepID=A0A0C9V3B7_SPHS4|nr:hypothetical protein M422DRAFT_266257 [Sphaerobolus stellatus SS14]
MGAVILPNASTAQANGTKETIDALYTRLQFCRMRMVLYLARLMHGAKTLSLRMKEHGRGGKTGAIPPCASDYPSAPRARKFVDEWVLADEAKEGNERTGKGDSHSADSLVRTGRVDVLANDGAAERFLTRTRLFTLAERFRGVESLAELPEKMMHGSIPPAERLALGITPDLVRLSVSVEAVNDLIADVEQALSWAINGWNSATTSVAFGDSELS